MPALFSLGLHAVLCAVNRMLPNERLLAFLDDIYALCRLARVSDVFVALQEELWAHPRIQVLQAVGKLSLPRPHFRPRGGDPSLPLAEQGVKVLGTPLGHTKFLKAQLREVINSHSILWERIPSVPDQSAWLLLVFCADPIICSAAFLPMWLTNMRGTTMTPCGAAESCPHGKICKEAPFPGRRVRSRPE